MILWGLKLNSLFRNFLFLFSACFIFSCSTGYVLHHRAQEVLSFDRDESGANSALNGLILSYDRAPYVLIESPRSDGSVILHYALQIQNSTPEPKRISTRGIVLKADDREFKARFTSADEVGDFIEIGPHSTFRQTLWFKAAESAVEDYARTTRSIAMLVPVVGEERPLKLDLWVWQK